jgi:hypothetical protein
MELQIDFREIKRLYEIKAKESFKARFDLLLFKHIITGNNDPITESALDSFKIEDQEAVLKQYINTYWQKEDYKSDQINGMIINDIYHAMKKWREEQKGLFVRLQKYYVTQIFPVVFPYEGFKDFITSRNECEYCHITVEKIKALIDAQLLNKKKDTRGWSLEIDRKKPNYEYTKENCVWCCYWCNNAKTDEFSYDEYKKIGKVIESIWDGRLSRKSEPSV